MNEKKPLTRDMIEKNNLTHSNSQNQIQNRTLTPSRGDSFQERRRQADWVISAAAILSLISWIVAFSVLLVLELAAPEQENFFTHTFNGTVRATWNETLLPLAFVLLIFAVIACAAAFVFNAMRMRRKTDKFRKSIIIIGLMTVVGLVAFTIRFAGYMF